MADKTQKRGGGVKPLQVVFLLALVVVTAAVAFRPDRPVATIVPGSSSGPAFVVQIIRPRLGLPLGGLLPPHLFGLDAALGFDSKSAGQAVGEVSPRRLELRSDDWELVLVMDDEGQITPETQVEFELIFEDRVRKVRCRPADPAVGRLTTTRLDGSGELAGHFDIELARCEDAGTGVSIDWPSQPLVLHGSFDRLPQGAGKPGR